MKKLCILIFTIFLFGSCSDKNREVNMKSSMEAGSSVEISEKAIEDFWALYRKVEKDFLKSYNAGDKYQNKYLFQLNEELKKMDINLEMEIKQNTKDKRVLTLTSNGIPELFPAIIKIAKKAPKGSLWKIEALRQRVELPILVEYKDMIMSSETLEFAYRKREDNKIDLEVVYPVVTEDSLFITYIFIDGLLGEFDASKYIGEIIISDKKNPDEQYFPLNSLRETVDKSLKK